MMQVVGHSLGAGTTALLVTLIKNGLYERAQEQATNAAPSSNANTAVSSLTILLLMLMMLW
jgi:hypothetical protein